MKKKLFIIIGIIAAIALTSAISFAVTNSIMTNKKHVPSDYKVGVPYSAAIKSDKPMIALFYVDWCGYCLKFMPRFRLLHTIYKDKFNFVMLNAEETENKKLVDDVTIAGFPTVYILDPKYENRVCLTNGIYMDLGKFRAELDRFLRIRTMLDSSQPQK